MQQSQNDRQRQSRTQQMDDAEILETVTINRRIRKKQDRVNKFRDARANRSVTTAVTATVAAEAAAVTMQASGSVIQKTAKAANGKADSCNGRPNAHRMLGVLVDSSRGVLTTRSANGSSLPCSSRLSSFLG